MLKRHLNGCRECALESERYSAVARKAAVAPHADATGGFDHASAGGCFQGADGVLRGASPWSRWRDRVELSLRNLMRPLALPAVGGLCSAVFLFSTLVPMFKSAFAMSASGDVPTMLATAADAEVHGAGRFRRTGTRWWICSSTTRARSSISRSSARPASRARRCAAASRTTCCSPNSGPPRRSAAG